MRRREFIALLGAAAWPLAARAQLGKVHRVGVIASTSPVSEMVGADPIHPLIRAFVHTLRDLGYVEGRNLVLEHRSAEGKFERFPEIVRELVSIKVDVIVTVTTPMTRAAMEVTQTVPIVMISGNPVEEGLVQSLARPGGNVTGASPISGAENNVKRVQLLKELLPGMSRVAYLQSKVEMLTSLDKMYKVVSQDLGVKLLFAEHKPADYAGAFFLIERERPDALLVAASAANFANRPLIVEFAAKNRLPAIYPDRAFVTAGGLVALGPDHVDVFRLLARYVDRILNGRKPADLPVEQPTKFELVINLKTAKALGLAVPPSLLARADEVIE
jgi:putative tryptophan/tyrosine transport system substrate-binding protein